MFPTFMPIARKFGARPALALAHRCQVMRPVLGWVLAGVLAGVLSVWAVDAPAQALSPKAASTVVIWDFEDHTAASAASAASLRHVEFLQRTLPDAVLESLLALPSLQVVDRFQLRDILAEQKLGSSELSDEASRLRLGRIIEPAVEVPLADVAGCVARRLQQLRQGDLARPQMHLAPLGDPGVDTIAVRGAAGQEGRP